MDEAERRRAAHRHDVQRAAHEIVVRLADRPAISCAALAAVLGSSEEEVTGLVRDGSFGPASELFGQWRVTVTGYRAYCAGSDRQLPDAETVVCHELDGFAGDRLEALVAALRAGPRAAAYRP
jgi:hypothetical protein